MMRFSHYLLRDFFRIFFLSLSAFTGLYLLVDFFEKVDNFLEAGAALEHYLIFFGCKTPVIAQQLMPMAVLMAAFMTLAGLARTSELTAMRAAGVSVTRLSLPLILAGLVLSLTSLLMTEYLTPVMAAQAFKVREIELSNKGNTIYRQHNIWLRTRTGVTQVRLADPQKQQLRGIRNFILSDDFQLTLHQQAQQADYEGSRWLMRQAESVYIDSKTGAVKSLPTEDTPLVGFNRTPEDFAQANLETDQMAVTQLYDMYQQYRREGLDSRRLKVDLHARIAGSFTCLIMAFLGVPFALQRGRQSNMATGMTISMLVGVTFFVFQAVITAFGYSGALPAAIAAWSGNLLFLLFGGFLLLTIRE